jgi:hypothetical protein
MIRSGGHYLSTCRFIRHPVFFYLLFSHIWKLPTSPLVQKGSKKQDGWIVPSMQDPNQLLGSTVYACFPQIQYSPLGSCQSMSEVRLSQAAPEIREVGQWTRLGFHVVWNSSPLGLLSGAIVLSKLNPPRGWRTDLLKGRSSNSQW